jgi:hypothetical protein
MAEVATTLALPVGNVRESFQRLAAGHVLVLQSNGEILMANPFSAVPTPFVVQTSGYSCFGNCIWDALGIPAMLKADATIRTACGCCGSAMSVSVRRETLGGDDGIVHFAIPAMRWWDDIVFT